MAGARDSMTPLELLLRDGSDEDIARFFLLLRPPEIADVVESFPEEQRLRIVRLLGAPLASDVLREVQEPELEDILEEMPAVEIAEIVHESRSDDAADIIGSLPPDKAERTLQNLEHQEQEELRELLEYDEETAGGIMQTEFVSVPAGSTVEVAREAVHDADRKETGKIHFVYVTDSEGRMIGTITPADLLRAEPEAAVETMLDPNPVKVLVDVDQERIARLAQEHDLPAMPVVDDDNRLLGQVLHDDLIDVVEEEATEDIARMAGTKDEEIYDDSVLVAVKSRAPWLFLTFGGGLLVAGFLSTVEADIAKLPVLLMFLPVVLGMAGNVGTQTSAITVRSLALDRIDFTRWITPVARQIVTGLILGMIFGAILYAFSFWRMPEYAERKTMALALGLAIFCAITTGAVMGVLVPLLIHRIGLDPAISSSPFIQTANDLTGAGILFLVARAMGLLG
ncbi:MAG: magnesium transporter [Planctomycetota bacterium]|jgi:magnesium transporter